MPRFAALAADGTAVIFVSHRLDEVLALTDRVSVLQDGRMSAHARLTRDLTESSLAALMLGRELGAVGGASDGGRCVSRSVA